MNRSRFFILAGMSLLSLSFVLQTAAAETPSQPSHPSRLPRSSVTSEVFAGVDLARSPRSPKTSEIEMGVDSARSPRSPKTSEIEMGADSARSPRSPKTSEIEMGADSARSPRSRKTSEIEMGADSARSPRSRKTSEIEMGVDSARSPRSPKTSEIVVYLPFVPIGQPIVRVAALYYDSETAGEPDEAFRLWNVSSRPAQLAGYGVSDGRRTVTFPAMTLAPGTSLWCTGSALAFAGSFGFAPGCEYGATAGPCQPIWPASPSS